MKESSWLRERYGVSEKLGARQIPRNSKGWALESWNLSWGFSAYMWGIFWSANWCRRTHPTVPSVIQRRAGLDCMGKVGELTTKQHFPADFCFKILIWVIAFSSLSIIDYNLETIISSFLPDSLSVKACIHSIAKQTRKTSGFTNIIFSTNLLWRRKYFYFRFIVFFLLFYLSLAWCEICLTLAVLFPPITS